MLSVALALILAGTVFQHNSCVVALLNPIVSTIYGDVEGLTQFSEGNRLYSSFRGIPYAKAPIGQLRFRSPVPPEIWSDTLNATADGPMCIQKNFLFGEDPPVTGEEDCLFLNVYSPNDLNDPEAVKYPVMAFIHYGGFLSGTGQSASIGPEFFMDKDIVLVTFNYRLGVLGFLSTLDDASPGNFGLKDQVAALQWIQDNINSFGGDKNKVTIFGESAGSASVHHHILSPASRNLFHGAISESGSALSIWTNPDDELQKTYAREQAILVNCDLSYNHFDMVECLRNVDASDLVESSISFKYFSTEPFLMYLPVTEIQTDLNPNPFITKNPFDIIKSGDFNKVPWITGTNKDDGMLRAAPLVRQSATLQEFNDHFDEYGPEMLVYDMNEHANATWENIKDFYFNGQSYINSSDPISVQGLIDVYTDRLFTYAMYQSLLLHLSHYDSPPIWVYNFAYRGEYTYGDVLAATNETIDFQWGACHGDELIYLFKTPDMIGALHSSDDILRKAMIKLWTNFATYGDPTATSVVCENEIIWQPAQRLTEDNAKIYLNFLNITGPYPDGCPYKMEMNDEFFSDRIHFWKKQSILENELVV